MFLLVKSFGAHTLINPDHIVSVQEAVRGPEKELVTNVSLVSSPESFIQVDIDLYNFVQQLRALDIQINHMV